jgi:hypothetical protein
VPLVLFGLVLWISPAASASLAADDFAALIADRAAVERVYYDHRTGTKPAFEQAMPRELLQKLVQAEVEKETVLQRVYGVTITPEMVAVEVRRIDTTTRAPEMLAELKAALGGDPERFARTVARPIVVERTLRARFENDDVLHAPQRKAAEELRVQLLAAAAGARVELLKASKSGSINEVTWQLTPRPADDSAPKSPGASATPVKGRAASAAYSVEATVQVAQVLGAPEAAGGKPGVEREQKFYFEDLDPELQNVLRAQLGQPGDVSAVIETPTAFLLFVAKAKTPVELSVASFNLPKRSYEEWLAQQSRDKT